MNFNLVILGDSGVGKTAFIQRHLTGEFITNHKPTTKSQVKILDFYTTTGNINFNILDGAKPKHYANADTAILMFDQTNGKSYQRLTQWYNTFRQVCPTAPVVIVGNKIDIRHVVYRAEHIDIHRKLNLQYYPISAKSNYNFEKPFLYLARTLLNDSTLQLTGGPPPPTVQLSNNIYVES